MQLLVDDFLAAVQTGLAASQRAHQLDANGNYALPLDERVLVTQASFVRIFIAFEEFLEHSFGHYGMGGVSLQANSPRCYAQAPNVDHLHKMYIGLMRFVDWSTPDKVRALAKLYFANGEPFDGAIASVDAHLRDMKTVRNAASHVSRTTSAQAEALYLRWTAKPLVGATAYQILTAPNQGGVTFMAHGEQVLRAVVTQIANY